MKTIPINPALPDDFDGTPNHERPDSHTQWWYKPFIVTASGQSKSYAVRCLDGGAHDRSTLMGECRNLRQALSLAEAIARRYQSYHDQVMQEGRSPSLETLIRRIHSVEVERG